jgi:hypothetical protein
MEKEAILKFINKQNSRHSLTLKDGRVIPGGETFEAALSQIPEAFRDLVMIVSAGESIGAKKHNAELKAAEEAKEKQAPGTDEKLEDEIEQPANEIPDSDEDSPQQGNEPLTKTYAKKHIGKGKYDVLDEAGKAMNKTPLTGTKAQQLIDELTKK